MEEKDGGGVGQNKKRPAQLSGSGVGEISVKKAKAAPEPLFTSAEEDEESAEELTRLLEGGPEEVPFKVRFVPYPYTWRQPMSPPSSAYITINVGHEESCGSSFSDSDCSLMASVDLAGLNIGGGGACGGLARDARGRRPVDDSCSTSGAAACCSWDWDDLDEALATFVGE